MKLASLGALTALAGTLLTGCPDMMKSCGCGKPTVTEAKKEINPYEQPNHNNGKGTPTPPYTNPTWDLRYPPPSGNTANSGSNQVSKNFGKIGENYECDDSKQKLLRKLKREEIAGINDIEIDDSKVLYGDTDTNAYPFEFAITREYRVTTNKPGEVYSKEGKVIASIVNHVIKPLNGYENYNGKGYLSFPDTSMTNDLLVKPCSISISISDGEAIFNLRKGKPSSPPTSHIKPHERLPR